MKKYIPIVVLFFFSVPASVVSQYRDVITMPSPFEVSEVTIVDDTPQYFSAKSLHKLLPCFTPRHGRFNSDAQQGLLKLKNGQTMRWMAENHESIIILTDKTERSFFLSTGCSTVIQSVGKHKGLLKKAQNYGNLIREANFELVLEKADSKSNLYHAVVYVTNNFNGGIVDLSQSGYAGIRLNSKGKQTNINLYKELNKETVGCAAAKGCFRSMEKFAATSDLQIEVIIAFPSKIGTGIAIFEPFKDNSKQ